MKRSILALIPFALFLMLSVSLQAAEVSGKWSGTFSATAPDGNSNAGPVMMVLKQSGETVTGTAGPSEERQAAIQGGKVAGSQVTFRVLVDDASVEVTVTVDGDQMKGQAVIDTPDGKVTAKLDLKRA